MQHTEMTTPEHVNVHYRLTGLGTRSLAHLLDTMILAAMIIPLYILWGLLSSVPFVVEFMLDVNLRWKDYIIAILLITLFVLIWGYFALFEFFTGGRTPGKMAFGIRVMQDSGQSVTFLSSFIRNLLRIVDILPSFYLLGMLMTFFHPRHKRIGDLVAGTMVVYERKIGRKQRKAPFEKEIENRGVTAQRLFLESWVIAKLTINEWKLISTFIKRRHTLPKQEREQFTYQLVEILFPIIELSYQGKPMEELENDLFALYLIMKEEWEI